MNAPGLGRLRALIASAAVCLLASTIGLVPASAQSHLAGTPFPQDVAGRDALIVEQATLLNAYRCLFGVDTEAVPEGCSGGEPAEDPVPLPAPEGVPSQYDFAVRDRVIAVQESLLNAYRCLFGVDTEAVPEGCPNRPRVWATCYRHPRGRSARAFAAGQAVVVTAGPRCRVSAGEEFRVALQLPAAAG